MPDPEEHEPDRPKLATIADWIAKVVPYLPSATFVTVGALLVAYGLFDLADHYQTQGERHTQTIFGHRLASHGVGAVSFLAGVALIALGMNVVRRPRN